MDNEEAVAWKDLEHLVLPDALPAMEQWHKRIILAHLNRCSSVFGKEFYSLHRGVMISQLARMRVFVTHKQ